MNADGECSWEWQATGRKEKNHEGIISGTGISWHAQTHYAIRPTPPPQYMHNRDFTLRISRRAARSGNKANEGSSKHDLSPSSPPDNYGPRDPQLLSLGSCRSKPPCVRNVEHVGGPSPGTDKTPYRLSIPSESRHHIRSQSLLRESFLPAGASAIVRAVCAPTNPTRYRPLALENAGLARYPPRASFVSLVPS